MKPSGGVHATLESPSDPATGLSPADAIVVLAGGDGERISRALDLIGSGVSSTLVLSIDGNAVWDSSTVEAVGGQVSGFRLLRFDPSPPSTEGEARRVGVLAARQGWQSIVLVTSSYHMCRARLWFRRHVGCEVRPAPARARVTPRALFHEVAGLALAMITPYLQENVTRRRRRHD